MSALVHHYTSESHHLPMILASGELCPSIDAGFEHEPPLLWFSRNQQWEVTVSRMAKKRGNGLRPLTFRQQWAILGWVRFSLPADDSRLMIWPDACRYAGIDSASRRQMEAKGRRRGASPTDWLAIATDVLLADVRLQRFDGSAWVDLAIADAEEQAVMRLLRFDRSAWVKGGDA